ncbi:MAG: peptide ABC transporter substrate-binding protein, partial [Candidatus Melainabacteria bacterium]|nr:peptide ABC transporter substrate-binding protein [Candidatus Melainabacteria bacterium]
MLLRLKPLSLLLLLLAVASSVVGWLLWQKPSTSTENNPPAVKPAQLLTLNLGTEPPTLDPALAVDLTSGTVIDQLYQGLTS